MFGGLQVAISLSASLCCNLPPAHRQHGCSPCEAKDTTFCQPAKEVVRASSVSPPTVTDHGVGPEVVVSDSRLTGKNANVEGFCNNDATDEHEDHGEAEAEPSHDRGSPNVLELSGERSGAERVR